MTATTVREYRICTDLLEAARDKVATVNRRLTRLGLPTYAVTFTDAPARPVYDDAYATCLVDGVPHTMEDGRRVPCPIIGWQLMVDVSVTGDLPRLADWEPVAVLTREQGGPVITRVFPGLAVEPNLAAFRDEDTAGDCDHCHTIRERNDTFIVRNVVTGELKQVGRTCLAAFTGIALNINTWLTSSTALDEIGTYGGGGELRWPVLDVLTQTLAVVALAGWCSRTRAQEMMGTQQATADVVMTALRGTGESAHALRMALHPHLEAAAAAAPAVLAYAAALATTEPDGGEYVHNLSTVAAQEWVGPRNLPLLCSAVASYRRGQERAVEAAAAPDSTWQGEVGKRQDWTLTVAHTTSIATHFGTSTLIVMVDAAGNRFKWFASGVWTVEPGEVLVLKGTVKAHDTYRGVVETVLTRCKIAARTPAPPAVAA